MSARDESCTTGTVQSCQQYELIVSWHVGPEEAKAGGGFIPLGAAWSSAGVLDLVIRLWGRATQRKSPLNSEEALKACSPLHQKRRGKKSCSFFFSSIQAQIQLASTQEMKRLQDPLIWIQSLIVSTSDWTISGQGQCLLHRAKSFLAEFCLCKSMFQLVFSTMRFSFCHHYSVLHVKIICIIEKTTNPIIEHLTWHAWVLQFVVLLTVHMEITGWNVNSHEIYTAKEGKGPWLYFHLRHCIIHEIVCSGF